MDYVTFDRGGNEMPLLINKRLIRVVTPVGEGRVRITFDNDHSVTVNGTLDDCLNKLA